MNPPHLPEAPPPRTRPESVWLIFALCGIGVFSALAGLAWMFLSVQRDAVQKARATIDGNPQLKARSEEIRKNGLNEENLFLLTDRYNLSGDYALLEKLQNSKKSSFEIGHAMSRLRFKGTDEEFLFVTSLLQRRKDKEIFSAALRALPQFSRHEAETRLIAVEFLTHPPGNDIGEKSAVQADAIGVLTRLKSPKSTAYLKDRLIRRSDSSERIVILNSLWNNDRKLYLKFKADPAIQALGVRFAH